MTKTTVPQISGERWFYAALGWADLRLSAVSY